MASSGVELEDGGIGGGVGGGDGSSGSAGEEGAAEAKGPMCAVVYVAPQGGEVKTASPIMLTGKMTQSP